MYTEENLLRSTKDLDLHSGPDQDQLEFKLGIKRFINKDLEDVDFISQRKKKLQRASTRTSPQKSISSHNIIENGS